MRKTLLPILLLVLLFARCQNDTAARDTTTATTPPPATAIADTSRLIGVMQKSAEDWNKGDLAGFMDSYDDSATMMSRHGLINKDSMMAHYQQTYFSKGAARQQLTFDQLQITPLAGDYVLLTGRFTLDGNQLPTQSGHFSLVCVHRKKGWKILHDHTS
ncbi:MAG TPA: nuclear transport factor 2 family protein [Puia sp.]|nr:nuclear transport factor 2 family protein [Puia sp.]